MFNELVSSLENNNINLGQDSTKIKSALQTRDAEKIANTIKASMRTLGSIVEAEIPYKEWNEYNNIMKPNWNNMQIFYLLILSLNQAMYFSKLDIDFDYLPSPLDIQKFNKIITNLFRIIKEY